MKIAAFIFARGGSKGVVGKNVRMLGDKPLIGWSIEHARSVQDIGRVIVSTDCTNIATIARSFGAEVPFIRPSELAQDDSPEWDAWAHALNFLLEHEGSLPDIMVSVPATSPMRLPQDIKSCIDCYISGDYDAVIAVTESNRSPYFNMVSMGAHNQARLIMGVDQQYARRQDVPKTFDITTVAYVLNPKFVLNNSYLFAGRVGAVCIPRERSLDIDTEFDFQIAQCMIKQR